MIDPTERWPRYGEKPDYAGLLTFAGMPYTEDAAELAGVDVAIVGAPMDELVSDSPGHALRAAGDPRRRRARPARTSRPASTRCAELRVVDFGDAPVIPADPVALARRDRAHRRARCSTPARSRSSSAATTRSPSPTSAPAPRATGRVGLIHFDTHTDTGREVFGVELSHGTPMYRLVERRPRRPAPLRPDRPARLLAGRGGVRLAARAGDHLASSCTTSATAGSRAVVERRARRSSAPARSSCPSTSTCSTPPSRPAPARPSRAA